MQNITRKSLLQLPRRQRNTTSIYDSIIIFKSGKKHESGYAIMNIVGCIEQEPVELIAGYCDSINWKFNGLEFGTDMLYPAGLVHFFGIDCKLKVGVDLSTTVIELIEE